MPNELLHTMLPTELEFVASDELVTIVPTVKMDKIRFISGIYGPFVGGRPTTVPLWLAVNLKLKKKCNIVPPDWLSVEFLQDKLSVETDERLKDGFARFPFRYAEIAKVLLDVASDNLEESDKIRSLLKDIREARQSKIRNSLMRLQPTHLDLTGLCSMEVNEIRPFLGQAMRTLARLRLTDIDSMGPGPEEESFSSSAGLFA